MKTITLKMNAAAIRKSQIQQGFFDGRFVARAEKSKKVYSRKTKHKNQHDS